MARAKAAATKTAPKRKAAPRAKATPKASAGEEVEIKSEGGTEVAESPVRRGLAPLLDIEREIERAFENVFNRGWLRSPRWEFPSLREAFGEKIPKVNVVDRDTEVVVKAELPGVQKDDIDVSLSENTVTIKASTRKEEEEEKGDYHRHEISTGYFSRTVPLPAAIDGNKTKAAFKDGVLTLTLPKTAASKRVNVKVD